MLEALAVPGSQKFSDYIVLLRFLWHLSWCAGPTADWGSRVAKMTGLQNLKPVWMLDRRAGLEVPMGLHAKKCPSGVGW